MRQIFLSFILMLTACAWQNKQNNTLRTSVLAFYDHLRWKRFESAALFLPEVKQAQFIERSLKLEDDLALHSAEVRTFTIEQQKPFIKAKVVIQTQFTLLPSTTVQKKTLVQTWENHANNWVLSDDLDEILTPED